MTPSITLYKEGWSVLVAITSREGQIHTIPMSWGCRLRHRFPLNSRHRLRKHGTCPPRRSWYGRLPCTRRLDQRDHQLSSWIERWLENPDGEEEGTKRQEEDLKGPRRKRGTRTHLQEPIDTRAHRPPLLRKLGLHNVERQH